jgi:hypothetical protein
MAAIFLAQKTRWAKVVLIIFFYHSQLKMIMFFSPNHSGVFVGVTRTFLGFISSISLDLTISQRINNVSGIPNLMRVYLESYKKKTWLLVNSTHWATAKKKKNPLGYRRTCLIWALAHGQ